MKFMLFSGSRFLALSLLLSKHPTLWFPRIINQANVFNQSATFEGYVVALHRQIFDESEAIATGEHITIGILYFYLIGHCGFTINWRTAVDAIRTLPEQRAAVTLISQTTQNPH